MPSTHSTAEARFQRIGADELRRRLAGDRAPLILDVRRGAAFEEQAGVPTAVPFALDRDPIRLPDLRHDHPILAYCL